ncbi:tetratricopeptide repeat protein [Microcoleus sp. FACHB-SPT15]|uniref:serine/threonine-protein kinase n=1 Tax=Microcoleus sp. FACHB-SPT15 TaxID=2692830 RepID=UPI001781081D|nr:serine/threonine-protein kinase [Microcoleus sp. FACHB-SPT15]MBD1806750.1 tetratricopeptide repeat protein [Microcoleus sp. FACHB-SPT15]
MGLNLLRLFQPTDPDKPLGGRYKIVSELGAGGFGQTFLAEDLHLPGHPPCVVKQLKPQVSDAAGLQTARRLFDIEAQVLYQLGNHDQIPRLLAHFEDNQEFYLAQELIEGEPLTQEFVGGRLWQEERVIALLQDLLQVLAFVHQQHVIHRDIKPSNLIRRKHDRKIVLIDFGAVKQASTQVVSPQSGQTKTISIGTQGYTPKEQLGGNPRFSSDVYAVGIIGIQALTGIHPRRLQENPQTGEIEWRNHAEQVSPELAAFLDQMVRYDFRVRYPTAAEALEALRNLSGTPINAEPPTQEWLEATSGLHLQPQPTGEAIGTEGDSTPTNIWVPTEPPVQLQPNNTGTRTGSDSTPTNSWVPPEPPVVPQQTSEATGSTNSRQQSQHLNSGSSTPTVTTPSVAHRRSIKLLPILGVLVAVGATALLAKTLLSPEFTNQIADAIATRLGELRTNPENRSAQKPTLRFPDDSATESPTPNSTDKPTSSSPDNSATESPTPNSTDKPTSSSPSPSTSAKPTPSPTQPTAKPTTAPAQPTAKPTPSPAQRPATPAPPRSEPQQEDAQTYWNSCYNLNIQQQYAKAIAACDQALALNPNYPEALWSKGFALDQQKQHQEALALYQQATTLKPDFAEAWSNQGGALLLLNRPEEAIAAYDQATALKPGLAAAWRDRGAALLELGRVDEAIFSLQKALQLEPNDEYAVNLFMKAKIRRGRL